jgi:hypothetical protein
MYFVVSGEKTGEEKCPCVARVSLSSGNMWCDIYMRFSFMTLADRNELDKYRDVVVDDETERCKLPHRDGVVDCIIYCGDEARGVEFKSYAEKKPVSELIEEVENKYLQNAKCDDRCVLILVVPGHRLSCVSTILGGMRIRYKIVTDTDIGKLQESIYKCRNRVVVVGINRAGVRSCTDRQR